MTSPGAFHRSGPAMTAAFAAPPAPGGGAAIDAVDVARLYRKVSWRLVPLIMIGCVVAYVDRVNVGIAKLQFVKQLGFDEAVYGTGAGLFYAGYFLFELPSNLLLERVGARVTLMRIMVLWGLISAAMAFVQTATQFYVLRFLLGAAEAGFFPGIFYYLGFWFPAERRGRITAYFLMGLAVAGIVGSPISGWLMSLEGMQGLRGWQILFIYEGLPACLLGIVYYLVLSDSPAEASWLSPPEKRHLAEVAAAGRAADPGAGRSGIGRLLREPRVYVFALTYLSILAGTQAVALWTPTLMGRFGYGIRSIGGLTAVPYLAAVASMLALGHSSDRFMERRWHFAAAIWAAAASLIGLGLAGGSPVATIALLALAASGCLASMAVFWTMPPGQLAPESKAAGIAIISSAGAIGGFVSPIIVGSSSRLTGSLHGGMAVIGLLLFASGVILLAFTRRGLR